MMARQEQGGPGYIDAEHQAQIARCAARHTAAVQLVEQLHKVIAFCQQALNTESRSA